MVERVVRIQEVSGSNPLISTISERTDIHKGYPFFLIIPAKWQISGFEGDCAEVQAVRRTEGKNDSVNHF